MEPEENNMEPEENNMEPEENNMEPEGFDEEPDYIDVEPEFELVYFEDPETGEETPFFVLEQTCVAGITYLLVAEDEEEDSYGYILREIQTDEDDVIYEVVEDEEELRAISRIFSELIDDIDLDCD